VEPAFDPGAGLVRLFTLGVFGQPAVHPPLSDGELH
jgi:hypothetical protein